MNNKQEKVDIKITIQEAKYLDALLWKEHQAKRKRVNTNNEYFALELQDKIAVQANIMPSDDQLEYMDFIQREGEK